MKARANTAVRTRFAGWPKPALQFFHGLKRDNSKAYFEAHRQVYEEQVRQPMEALLAEIEQDLGPDMDVKIFRLNRDLRFSPDKRPYKEHLGAYLSSARASGVYLQVSNDGLYLAIGSHEMAPDQLTRFREAVAGKEGEKLARIVAALVKDGYELTEPSFKRVPAGYPADHPRRDLLRCKGLMAGRNWKPAAWLHTVEAKARIRDAIKDSKALTSWLNTNVGPTREPARQTR
jgi:uncharacterized protein (TIGR02453 family)